MRHAIGSIDHPDPETFLQFYRLLSTYSLVKPPKRSSAAGLEIPRRWQWLSVWIVTGDEMWVHHFTPESKAASMEWKHLSSPVRKKFKTTPSAGKVLLTVFWDAQGVLLLDFLEVGTINATRYCDTLSKLKEAIREKRSCPLTSDLLLLDDNAKP